MLTGFIVALFTEMWGVPLSLLLITSIGGGHLPYQFDNLMYYFTQAKSPSDLAFVNPPFAWLVEYLVARGITLLSIFPIVYGWFYLKRNINNGLVTGGPYAYSRNPQYIGFILFVVGMALYWPTLITIPMACILCVAYYRLALSEEKLIAKTYETQYSEYSSKVPRFLGRNILRIFRLPSGLNTVESLVEVALLLPFVLWFAEALAGIVFGANLVRTYWFPIAYVLPVHIGVIFSLAILTFAGIISLVMRLGRRLRFSKLVSSLDLNHNSLAPTRT